MNAVPGDYRGYSLAPFYFTNDGVGGYVAAGSKTDLSTSAKDSVNIVLIPDVSGVSPTSFNLGITGATDVRAVSINFLGGAQDLFAVTLQVRGGSQKDRIAFVLLSASTYSASPTVVFVKELELPDRNWYPTAAEFDNSDAFYICGFATDPSVGGYPHEPLLTDSKTAFILRYSFNVNANIGNFIEYNLFDSPIPMTPPPPGVTWNGLYNDYDVAQHIRVKGNGANIILTGSANGETNTSWGGVPWLVNTSSAFMYNLDTFEMKGYNYISHHSGSNGDNWTLPEVLPNRLPSDPSGLSAVDAMYDATGATHGYWVVQNRLDTTQWHLTHITTNIINGVEVDTVSGASGDGFNTLRDSLYKNAIVYGGQRQRFPLSTALSPIGIYGKYGTDPFLISLDPFFRTTYVSGMFTYSYNHARSAANLFMAYPTLSPEPTMVPEYYPYWMNSDCARYNLPNSGTRFSTGSSPNYFAQMGTYGLGGSATGRFIQGDDYGQQGTSICTGAFNDITSTDLLLGNINVVRSGDFGNGPNSLYNHWLEMGTPFTCSIFGAGTIVDDCNASSGTRFRQALAISGTSRLSDIVISPNPASDYVNIAWGQMAELRKDKATVAIHDMLGKQVLNYAVQFSGSLESRIALPALSPGMYFINCTVNGQLVKAAKLSIVQ